MKSDKLYSEFLEAVKLVNDYKKPLPADLLLKLYAYYKIANKNYNNP
ncbi:MAG: acyl-CoA-binding protein, partial [Eudoraea sp.]